MNNTQLLKTAFVTLLACACVVSTSRAQSADALIDKLVEKGILTVKEATELREETEKNFSQAYAVKSGMPDWVTALKFNGDFRGRYEGFFSDNPNFVDRSRLRYRVRLGVTATLLDDFEVGLRLGSGDTVSGFSQSTGNPVSGNTTFQDNASRKFIYVDLAYAKWSPWNAPAGSAAFALGKIENPFTFTTMVFDPDYNPEGFGTQLSFNLSEQHVVRFNGGIFVLDELSASSHDPWLFGGQLRLESVWTPRFSSSLGASFLSISAKESLSNANVPNVNRGNTRDTNGIPVAHFNPVVGDGWLTYNLNSFPGYNAQFPIRVGGEFLYNPAISHKNYAWSAGLVLGKAGKRRLWELSYQYRYIGADSWYEELPDDDFGGYYQVQQTGSGFTGAGAGYAGGTNVRGHYIRASYSPFDSLTLSVSYFRVDLIDPSPPGSQSDMNHILADLMWRF